MAGCQHGGGRPGGVVEVWVDPVRVELAGVEQLDRHPVQRCAALHRPPRPGSLRPPLVVADQPVGTEAGLQHQLRVPAHNPAGGCRLPERVRVSVVGHQDRDGVTPGPQMRGDVVAVVTESSWLRPNRSAAHLDPIDPQHVSGVGRYPQRDTRRNLLKVETATELASREAGRRQVRAHTGRIDREVGNIRGHPVPRPPDASEVSVRHDYLLLGRRAAIVWENTQDLLPGGVSAEESRAGLACVQPDRRRTCPGC